MLSPTRAHTCAHGTGACVFFSNCSVSRFGPSVSLSHPSVSHSPIRLPHSPFFCLSLPHSSVSHSPTRLSPSVSHSSLSHSPIRLSLTLLFVLTVSLSLAPSLPLLAPPFLLVFVNPSIPPVFSRGFRFSSTLARHPHCNAKHLCLGSNPGRMAALALSALAE